jgi:biotin carboxylase
MPSRRVVVVGTTADYIDLIRRRHPGRVLFVTDPSERTKALEEDAGEGEELLSDLANTVTVVNALRDHMGRHGIVADGVACFDCESLGLAARVAEELRLPFPSASAVALSRNKFLSKITWQNANIACPGAAIARSPSDAVRFLDRLGGPVILKPLTGSGSELVFKCARRSDCLAAYETITEQLSGSKDNRMYMPEQEGCGSFDPLRDIVVEEFISGEEYSCDFYIDGKHLEVIRTAKKIPAAGYQVGTTAAYAVPARLSPEISLAAFQEQLHRAARVLGLQRALCMVDFIVRKERPHLLELTPRAGGDCLPWLIRQSSGLDILGLALDFAQGLEVSLPPAEDWDALVGLRLFAADAGVVRELDSRLLHQDSRVREVLIKCRPGHRVVLPPKDYDSQLLGHLIFKPSETIPLEEECVALASKLIIKMEPQP